MKTEISSKEFRWKCAGHIGELRSVYDVIVRMNKIAWKMADVNADSVRDKGSSRCFGINGKWKGVEL